MLQFDTSYLDCRTASRCSRLGDVTRMACATSPSWSPMRMSVSLFLTFQRSSSGHGFILIILTGSYWCVLRREFSGMIHFIVMSSSQQPQPIQQPCQLSTSKTVSYGDRERRIVLREEWLFADEFRYFRSTAIWKCYEMLHVAIQIILMILMYTVYCGLFALGLNRKIMTGLGRARTPWDSMAEYPARSISVCHTRLQNLTSFDTQLETQDTLSNRVDAQQGHTQDWWLRMTAGFTGFKMTFPAWLKFLRYTRSQDILAKVLYHHGGVYIDFDMHLVCTSTSVAASCKSSTLSSRCRWHFEN